VLKSLILLKTLVQLQLLLLLLLKQLQQQRLLMIRKVLLVKKHQRKKKRNKKKKIQMQKKIWVLAYSIKIPSINNTHYKTISHRFSVFINDVCVSIVYDLK